MARASIFTDEQIAVMNKHHIPRNVARLRVKKLKWPVDKAITKAVAKKREKTTKKDEDKTMPPIPNPEEAYRRFVESRKDKSHLEKYPQSVKASDYYKYLESKVSWS